MNRPCPICPGRSNYKGRIDVAQMVCVAGVMVKNTMACDVCDEHEMLPDPRYERSALAFINSFGVSDT